MASNLIMELISGGRLYRYLEIATTKGHNRSRDGVEPKPLC